MKGWMLLLMWTAVAALVALIAGWASVATWTNGNSGLASWVQAVGSIVAIGATAGLVFWQHDLERKRARDADRELRRRKLSVIVEIARATSNHADWLKEQFPDRGAVHDIATGARFLDRRAIRNFGLQAEAIPLHELDDVVFVNEVLILTAICLQARDKITMALEAHRVMDAAAFTDFFDFLAFNSNECTRCHQALKDRTAALCA